MDEQVSAAEAGAEPGEGKKKKKKKKGEDEDAQEGGGDVAALQARIEELEGDLKKEKKKHKKASGERDAYFEQIQGMKHTERNFCSRTGKIIRYAKLRAPSENDTQPIAVGLNPDDPNVVIVQDEGRSIHDAFTFDANFTDETTPADIFNELQFSVRSAMEGYNTVIVMYGTMHSGKSTLLSSLMPAAVKDLLKEGERARKSGQSQEVAFALSVLELSADGLTDLLNTSAASGLQVLHDSLGVVAVPNATRQPCNDYKEAVQVLQSAASQRRRPRSHLFYIVYVETRNKLTNISTFGRVEFVDLCGTGDLGEQSDAEAGKHVNLSNAALEEVIRHVSDPSATSVPYTSDPLGALLSDAFGGNALAHVLVTVSPTVATAPETSHALRTIEQLADCVNRPRPHIETAELPRLREIVSQAHSEEAVGARYVEVTAFRM